MPERSPSNGGVRSIKIKRLQENRHGWYVMNNVKGIAGFERIHR